jgi:hypothetical protein
MLMLLRKFNKPLANPYIHVQAAFMLMVLRKLGEPLANPYVHVQAAFMLMVLRKLGMQHAQILMSMYRQLSC